MAGRNPLGTALRAVPFIVAGALWIATAIGVATAWILMLVGTPEQAPWIGDLLGRDNGVGRVIALAITLVFAATLVDVATRARRLYGEYQEIAGLGRIEDAARGGSGSGTRVGARLAVVRQYYDSSPGQLHDLLPGVGALDAAALDNSYVLSRALVWTLPVLGFIGTAWGMSQAIGGFSGTLSQAGQLSTDLVTKSLSNRVIPGVAGAFTITMLALGLTVVAHFMVSVVQTLDEDLLRRLDDACVRMLAGIPQVRGGGLPEGSLHDMLAYLAQILSQLQVIGDRLAHVDAAAADLSLAARDLRGAAAELRAVATQPYHVTIERGEPSCEGTP